MEEDKRSLMELPKNIVEDVLTRLPVKSLIVCSCVSRTLQNLIERDSNFAKMQFAKSESQLMIQSNEMTNFHLINLDVSATLALGVRLEIKPSFNLPEDGFEVKHSCNGLILLEDVDHANAAHCGIVCNPITGEYIMLPESSYNCRNVMCAFFYCPKTNQFKVLRIFHCVYPKEDCGPSPDSGAVSDLSPDSYMELDPSSDSGSDVNQDSSMELVFSSYSGSDSDLDSNSSMELDLSSDSDSDSNSDFEILSADSETMGEILVGGSDTWEPLGQLPFSPLCVFSPCYFDKATHWICADESVPDLIVLFHFETHEFGELPSPLHM